MTNFIFGRWALAICVASAILVGCGGSQPLLEGSSAQTAVPMGQCDRFRVQPSNSTIGINEQLTLGAYKYLRFFRCGRVPVPATWSSNGGSLQVIDSGQEALFSASSPGVYTVHAKWDNHGAKATVTVSSP